jgi:beta-galactosidase
MTAGDSVRNGRMGEVTSAQSGQIALGSNNKQWPERGRATDAEVVASYADGPATGDPAVTRRSRGLGTAWYVGTRLPIAGLKDVVGRALGDANAGDLAVTLEAKAPPRD